MHAQTRKFLFQCEIKYIINYGKCFFSSSLYFELNSLINNCPHNKYYTRNFKSVIKYYTRFFSLFFINYALRINLLLLKLKYAAVINRNKNNRGHFPF